MYDDYSAILLDLKVKQFPSDEIFTEKRLLCNALITCEKSPKIPLGILLKKTI